MNAIEGFRLSPVQRPIWAKGSGVLRARLALTGPVDRERLTAALAVLADRHEALRLRLVEYPGLRAPLQVVDDKRPVPLADHGSSDPLCATLTDAELVLSGSRLSVDPASLGLLVRELVAVYSGRDLLDDEERPQFLDVSEWQLEQVGQTDHVTSGRTVIRKLDLPFPPGGSAGGASAEHVADITGEVLAGLRGVASERGCDLQALLMTAWSLTMAPHWDSGADDFAIAWYDEGRSVAGTNDVIGPLGCHVPLVLAATGNPQELLDATEAALAEALPRSLVTEPIDDPAQFAAGFAYIEGMRLDDAGDLPVASVSVDPPAPVGTLHLGCVNDVDRLRLTLTFDPAVHDSDVVHRLLDTVKALCASMPRALNDPEQLQSLGTAEADLLTAWSGKQSAYPETTLVDLLNAGIAQVPDTDAVIAADGTLTFAELDQAASVLAGRLVHTGVRPGERVGVLTERSWRTIVAFVGILRAGAVYVPLDPKTPAPRLRELTEHAGVTTVIGGSGSLPIDRDGDEHADVPVAPDDAAYVIFTSGSTGTPRPVVVQHRAASHLWHALAETVHTSGGQLRIAVNAPFTFDASIKQLVQLASGHTLCLVPEETRRDGRTLLDYLAELRCDVFDCTPSHLSVLLEARKAGDKLPGTLLIGGEAIGAELWRKVAALDGVRALNLYGPTECTVDVSVAEITGDQPAIGRPLPGTRVWVLDDDLRPVPAGAVGELCVSGLQLASGYQGDERATAARFVTATVADGTSVRLYRTGDLVGFTRDGRLEYVGRADDQVKINGHRVEPGEIAAALRRHPGVGQAVVIASDSGARLVGYAVPAKSARAVNPDRLAGVNPHETRYLYDEIFRQQVYLRGGITLRENAVVFDVGANIGMFSLFARATSPNARVLAFEPLATAFEKLQQNLATHGESVTALPYGLSATEREETFAFYPGYSMMSGQHSYADPAAEVQVVKRFLANERDQGAAGRDELLQDVDDLLADRFQVIEQRCRLRRLSDVIDEQGIDSVDLLKIDVQRAEADVLRGLDDRHWPKIQQIAMEVHDEPGTPTEGRLTQLRNLLTRIGFRVVVEQDELMAGTGRHSLYAVRPEYDLDPRPALPAPATEPGKPVDGPALVAWLAERLPDYLVPGAVVMLDQLPLTANGKIDRTALPSPDAARGVAPANRAEEILLEVWHEVLGRTDVGVQDKFFQFGGDSIKAIRVRAAAARWGLTFPLRNVVRYQTIRDLVRESGMDTAEEETANETAFSLVDPADRANLPDGLDDAYPVSVLQLGMIYHTELSAARAGYHVVTVHRIGAPLDVARLRKALADTFSAHPVLRTSFALGAFREPLQLVHSQVEPPLTVTEARSVEEIVAEERSRPFEWDRAPLARFHVLHNADDAFELVLSHYHGILDGWSLHLLLHEICARYAGDEVRAAGLPYRRFVELERAARDRKDSAEFWRARTAGADPLLVAKTPDGPARITAQHAKPLPAGLAERLEQVAATHEVPLKSLLLGVHMRALGEQTGRDDVIGGLVVNSRPAEDGGDRALGLFLNTLPIRLRLGTHSLAALAQRVWQAEQDLMGHNLLPLADIERAAGKGTLFDTFFNFTKFHSLGESTWKREDAEQDVPVDVAFGLAVDFEVDPATGALRLTLQYDGRQLSAAWIRSMAARYQRLLAEGPARELPPAGPVSQMSDQVAQIWRELTGGEPGSGDADFPTSGGSSLLALRFVAMMRDRHGVAIDLRDFRRDSRFDSVVRLVAAGKDRTT